MEDIERKLVKAKEFISMAKQNFEKNLYQLVCLQSNQAVEIMLKALIKQKTGKYPLEHHVDVLIERMGRDKSELRAEMQQLRTELIERMESQKTDLVKWMVGISIAFTTVIITAMWAILSFAR